MRTPSKVLLLAASLNAPQQWVVLGGCAHRCHELHHGLGAIFGSGISTVGAGMGFGGFRTFLGFRCFGGLEGFGISLESPFPVQLKSESSAEGFGFRA